MTGDHWKPRTKRKGVGKGDYPKEHRLKKRWGRGKKGKGRLGVSKENGRLKVAGFKMR